MKNPQPEWQPIEMMSTIATTMDAAQEVYMAELKDVALSIGDPMIWDRPTLQHIVEKHTESIENSWIYEEQFAQWKRESLSYDEELQLHRMIQQLKTLKRISKTALSIVAELESKLVDHHLAKQAVEFTFTLLNDEIRPSN